MIVHVSIFSIFIKFKKPSNHLEIYLIIQESDISTESQHTHKLTKTALLLHCENNTGRQKVPYMHPISFFFFLIRNHRYFLTPQMNIDDSREPTPSGKSTVDQFCYGFENLFHGLYIEHIATVL